MKIKKSKSPVVNEEVVANENATQQPVDNTKLVSPEGVKHTRVPFSVVEAYKSIRIHLLSVLKSVEDTNSKVIAISSFNAADGKSTTAVNIAITLSQLNKKVLLLDTDCRRPTVHQKTKLENETGCIDVLAGTVSIDDATRKYNDYMDVITSGTSAHSPSELYSAAGFDDLLSSLKERYDYIIVDTPPIGLISDTLVVAQKCDGLVIVVKAGVTTHGAMNSMIHTTKALNIKLLGVVLNGIDPKSNKYYKYTKYGSYGKYGKYGRYGKYGGYRYGYGKYYGGYY